MVWVIVEVKNRIGGGGWWHFFYCTDIYGKFTSTLLLNIITSLIAFGPVLSSSAPRHLHTMLRQLQPRKFLVTHWNLFVELNIYTSESE